MRFPNDIRYAHRIWMSMVLITPIFNNLLLVLFGEIPMSAIAMDYVFTVFKNGILLIIYWAILLVLVLSVNSKAYTINKKKWIIQFSNIVFLSLCFLIFILANGDIFTLRLLLLFLSYLIISSSAIWFFELKSRNEKDDFDIIEHLIEE